MPGGDRRRFLAAASAVLAGCASDSKKAPEDDGPNLLGKPVSDYGERSPFEKAKRARHDTRTPEQAASRTPLADIYGVITPNALHFERHHSGVPQIDPAKHRLMIHGLVDRPLIFTVDEIRQLPSVSRVHFIECSGNSGSEWTAQRAPDAQSSHGMVSCCEWTGVPLPLLLDEAGVKPAARWVIAEGADACKMHRSVPIAKARQDVLIAYAQNGEAIRPEQGYPMRLLVPGWEGNISVKWLRRIELSDQPAMGREETSKYTDLMPDGKARQFTFVMEAKSLITYPSGGQKLDRHGFVEVSGLAWSGRGVVAKVEISVDGGRTWRAAALQEPRLPMALTRFRFPWRWDGKESVLLSRCTDESGYMQRPRAELAGLRGANSFYHYNGIHGWRIAADGTVSSFVEAS